MINVPSARHQVFCVRVYHAYSGVFLYHAVFTLNAVKEILELAWQANYLVVHDNGFIICKTVVHHLHYAGVLRL